MSTGKHDIPAHVIAARGRKITLLDGSTPTIVYGFSSIMKLEEDFGSIDNALVELQGGKPEPKLDHLGNLIPLYDDDGKPRVDDEGTPIVKLKQRSPKMSVVAKIMSAGLEHETCDHGRLSDLDVLRYLLDSRELEAYSDAIGEAFALAFPQHVGSDDADPTIGEQHSPGQTGSTSQPSSSDAQMPSSGA